MMKKENRGGARKGAGRKPNDQPLTGKTVELEPEHLRWAEKLGGGNLSAGVRMLCDLGILHAIAAARTEIKD